MNSFLHQVEREHIYGDILCVFGTWRVQVLRGKTGTSPDGSPTTAFKIRSDGGMQVFLASHLQGNTPRQLPNPNNQPKGSVLGYVWVGWLGGWLARTPCRLKSNTIVRAVHSPNCMERSKQLVCIKISEETTRQSNQYKSRVVSLNLIQWDIWLDAYNYNTSRWSVISQH